MIFNKVDTELLIVFIIIFFIKLHYHIHTAVGILAGEKHCQAFDFWVKKVCLPPVSQQ